MRINRETGIAEGGQQRAYDASLRRIRAEVEAQYSEVLKSASAWTRVRIRFRIEREIRHRMRKVAPPDGLYSRH